MTYSPNGPNQPYATNLAREFEITSTTDGKCVMPDLDANARRFFVGYIDHKHPTKVYNNHVSYYNTQAIRQQLKKLP